MTQTARDLRPGRGTGLDTPLSASGRRVPRLAPNPDAFGEATEGIARFMGTPQFLVWMTLFCAAWLGWNTFGPMEWRFDSAELGFTALTLMLSLQASYAAPLLLLAQNRQEVRDKVVAEQDRQVNARAHADMEFLAREVASPIAAIDQLTVISSDGAGALPKQVTSNVVETLNMLKTSTGLDLEALIAKSVGQAAEGVGLQVAPTTPAAPRGDA